MIERIHNPLVLLAAVLPENPSLIELPESVKPLPLHYEIVKVSEDAGYEDHCINDKVILKDQAAIQLVELNGETYFFTDYRNIAITLS